MRFNIKLLCLLLIFQFILFSELVLAAENVSFVGADGSPDSFEYLNSLSKTGINFYGIEQMRWYVVEPGPPQKGVHSYQWQELDRIIKKVEAVKGKMLITIVCASTWATKQKNRGRVASPPEEDYWDDYKDFVQSLVERYDNDGNMDMPGLKYAHLYYQIEDEAENQTSWNGAKEEYIKLLKSAKAGALLANQNVKILSFSPNLGDFFDRKGPEQIQKLLKTVKQSNKDNGKNKVFGKLKFIQSVLEEKDAYDIIAVQYNYHYSGLEGIVKLLRTYSDKPIWVVDSATAPLLGRHQKDGEEYFKDQYPGLSEHEIATILSNPGNKKFNEIKGWWEAEKARTTFKKIVTAASYGVEHIFLQFMQDQRSEPQKGDKLGVNPWNFTGLMDGNGDLRPVSLKVKLFHEKLGGFSSVEDISLKDGDLSDWILHYRFKVREKAIDVLWTEGKEKHFKVSKDKDIVVSHEPVIIESN